METSGLTIYEYIEIPVSMIFPQAILDHAVFGFLLDLTVFGLAWFMLLVLAYVPLLIGGRLAMKGVKRWF